MTPRLLRTSLLFAAALICCAATARSAGRSGARLEATVTQVIDGDTVRLRDGRLLRYIGIDTPESRQKVGGEWREDAEPYAAEATDANRALVEGQRIRLEYDVERQDRYGRILAYVYVGELMVNAELIRLGYAQPMTIPPNVRYAERLRALADEARRAGRGLWAPPHR